MPLASISLTEAFSIYSLSSDGFINFSNSWVPFGRILKIYSAPTIAVIHDLGFLLIVERNKRPSYLSIFEHASTKEAGLGTCSKTSKQVTTS
jgi:hypothetical protein